MVLALVALPPVEFELLSNVLVLVALPPWAVLSLVLVALPP